MQVRTILDRKGRWVATISASKTLADAADDLARHGVGALVVSGDGVTIDGIISERDVVRALARDGVVALHQTVAALMTEAVLACRLDDTADALMALMTEHRVRHLPVVDNGQLVGLISIGDVVKHRVEELQVETQTLHEYLAAGR